MLRITVVLVLAALAIYALVLAATWRWQERVVYQPPSAAVARAFDGGAEPTVRRVSYAAGDGTPLYGYVVGDVATARRVVLAFHGNADLARWMVPWADEVARRTGSAVVLAEYRGYGGLGGTPTYPGVAMDAVAALHLVRESLGVRGDRLVLYGHSLGSAVAAELTRMVVPRALVLESPFTSARDMAARLGVPGIGSVFPLVSRVHYDTIERVRALSTAVWVAHGSRDGVVPARMGRAVFAAAARHGELLLVDGAGHNDVAAVGGERYWRWLADGILGEQRTSDATASPPAPSAP